MLGMGQMMAAGIAIGCAATAALVAIIHRYIVISGTAVGGNKMLGRGPYTTVACRPNHELVQKFAATLGELREAAREGDWAINWQPLDQSCREALAADEQENFAEAVRHYCRAISYVMNELRRQPSRT